MGALWAVVRLELTLLWRGWGFWITAVVMIALGALQASMVRQTPWGVWNHLVFTSMLITLLLTFTTGDQIQRDRDRRLDGVLFCTPSPTAAYVIGKYLATVAALHCLAGVALASALALDGVASWPDMPFFLGESDFPSLGARPYLLGWALLVIVPLLFGAALMLAGGALAHGGRVAAALVTLALWLLLPLFVGGWPAELDLAGLGAESRKATPYIDAAADALLTERMLRGSYRTVEQLPPEDKAQVVRLVREGVPPRLPDAFARNRAIFLGLAVALVGATIAGIGRQRGRT